MDTLSQLDRLLLDAVTEGRGEWSWHQIARHLADVDAPREPDMMVSLKDLVARGLLGRETTPGSPRDRWWVTDAGRAALGSGR